MNHSPDPTDLAAPRFALEQEATDDPIVRPTGPRQAELLARLHSCDWLRREGSGYVLTDEGRRLAEMALDLREEVA